jgi:thiamine transport system substrate-binding protein
LFTEDTGIEVELIASDDAGTLINQAVLSKDNPLADVLFGVDDTFLSRGIDEGIFRAHTAANIDVVDPDLRHEDDLVTPIDYGDVCFNYDKAWFEANDVVVPRRSRRSHIGDVRPARDRWNTPPPPHRAWLS